MTSHPSVGCDMSHVTKTNDMRCTRGSADFTLGADNGLSGELNCHATLDTDRSLGTLPSTFRASMSNEILECSAALALAADDHVGDDDVTSPLSLHSQGTYDIITHNKSTARARSAHLPCISCHLFYNCDPSIIAFRGFFWYHMQYS